MSREVFGEVQWRSAEDLVHGVEICGTFVLGHCGRKRGVGNGCNFEIRWRRHNEGFVSGAAGIWLVTQNMARNEVIKEDLEIGARMRPLGNDRTKTSSFSINKSDEHLMTDVVVV